MVFIFDDLILRSVGLSLPPFDLIWLMETIADNADESYQKGIRKWVLDNIKENSLLYELGEITKEEYIKRNDEFNQKLNDMDKVNKINSQRLNLLTDILNDDK